MSTQDWTDADRDALEAAEHDIAFAVAIGNEPRPDDLQKFRLLHRKHSLSLGWHPLFDADGKPC